MPRAITGVSSKSANRFLIDAGAVYLNYGLPNERLLGATRGGTTFEIEQEIKTIDIDGLKGTTIGARRIVSVTARITANLMEITTENLMLALAGSTSKPTDELGNAPATGTTATHNEIRRSRELGNMDFLPNVALVGRIWGTTENFVGLLYNVLADGGFSIDSEDREEAVLEIQFTAHYDPTASDVEPWAIRQPVLPA